MSRTERIRPTGAAVVLGAMIGAVALAGCGAGQVTQTSGQSAAVGGANAGTSEVVVRDARIEFADEVEGGNVYDRGSDAPLLMSIVNTGAEADRLVSASSPAASSVRISGEAEVPGGQVLVVSEPAASTTPAAPATPAVPGATASAAPSVPARPEAGQTPPPPASRPTAGSSPSGSPTDTADGQREAQIVLIGLREDVRAGITYPLVLTFARTGEIRLDVPVGNPSVPREDEPAG